MRVEAHRLRSKLKQYYRTEGRREALQIEIPKGAYLPSLRQRRSRKPVSRNVEPAPRGGGALRRSGRGTIAVLPFVNLTGAKRTECVVDSLTEDIISALAHVDGLRVVSRTSAFQFKGKAYDIREISERLRADAVLEGSVLKRGSRLRIHVRLIDATNGRCLWPETYERKATNLDSIANEISRAVPQFYN